MKQSADRPARLRSVVKRRWRRSSWLTIRAAPLAAESRRCSSRRTTHLREAVHDRRFSQIRRSPFASRASGFLRGTKKRRPRHLPVSATSQMGGEPAVGRTAGTGGDRPYGRRLRNARNRRIADITDCDLGGCYRSGSGPSPAILVGPCVALSAPQTGAQRSQILAHICAEEAVI